MKSVLSDAIENDFVDAVIRLNLHKIKLVVNLLWTGRGLSHGVRSAITKHMIRAFDTARSCVISLLGRDHLPGLEIISSTARARQAPRLGPAQSQPRPIQHTHDTVTRRGRAHVPRSSRAGGSAAILTVSATASAAAGQARPIGRGVLGSRILWKKISLSAGVGVSCTISTITI